MSGGSPKNDCGASFSLQRRLQPAVFARMLRRRMRGEFWPVLQRIGTNLFSDTRAATTGSRFPEIHPRKLAISTTTAGIPTFAAGPSHFSIALERSSSLTGLEI